MPCRMLKNYIDGQWTDVENSGYLDVVNPSTGQIIAQSPLSTGHEVKRAVAAASKAFLTWRKEPASKRVSYLFELLAQVKAEERRLVETLYGR